ncbi:hypothetical protein GQ44DRAFT_825820 [Phaeosphaeriaceae sp. PMI808]|nr:hypothetical protein GQ44DRAFT_825820 [Phaeosphaeriaceae sp. PMI808]
MSDMDVDVPSESTISQKLRDVVIAIHKAGNPDDLTLKRVRARAEKELNLSNGFLKSHPEWKQKSEKTIGDAVEKYCNEQPAPEPTPKKAAKSKPKPAEKKTKAAGATTKGVKRKAAAPAKKPKKRRKPDSDDDDIVEDMSESEPPADEPSEAESEPPKKSKLVRRGKKAVPGDSEEEASPKKPVKRAKKPVIEDESENEPAATPVKKPATAPLPETKGDVSESEMSSLIDESPKKKSRQKKEPAAMAKKDTKPAAPKSKAAKSDDGPDATEIKQLQGWLVKCGIRKVWSRDPELSKCNTDKEKIKVLKSMLKDVGMDGKFSVEKAAKIKEQREFAKDLAAIQEAEVHWGTTGDANASGRPRRRAAAVAATRPQQKLVLSDDDEEEEEEGNQDDEESSMGDDESDNNESEDDKDDSGDEDSE